MNLLNLSLVNFRNFSSAFFDFSPKATLIVGRNTTGKTNILEGIYLLATAKSFRAETEKEMIKYQAQSANIKCQIANGEILEIILVAKELFGEKLPRKKYLINGVTKRMINFIGNLRAVLFWPQDLELVTDSPSIRRKYLDLVLSQVDWEYRRSLLVYEKGLRQRNKLLEMIKEGKAKQAQLLFWDKLLIKHGGVLTEKRAEYFDKINQFQVLPPELKSKFQIEYDKSLISQARLEQYKNEEIEAGATLVGPHRDDFIFLIKDFQLSPRNLSLFGSRGEQRMAILWLKLVELEFITQKTNERPVLLLDDIFSEFDEEHRRLVFEIIQNQQTIITTTDLSLIKKEFLKNTKIIDLK